MKRTDYTEAEKLAAMSWAILTSPTQASHDLDIPRKTISHWIDKAGGVAAVRQELESKALSALQDARRVTALEWVRRIQDLPDDQLGETMRAMLKESAPTDGAKAQASAGVILVQMRDGEVIELPDPDAGAHQGDP